MNEYWVILALIAVTFGLIVFRGAPYVPTHHQRLGKGLDLLKLSANDLLVDLGSGDGNVLRAAAKRGWRARGYELNPLLCAVTWIRSLPQRSSITIRMRDYWGQEMPPETAAIYVFLAGPYMTRLSRKLEAIMVQHERPLQVLSYAFEIPGFKPEKVADGFYLYRLEPGAKALKPLQTGA